MSLLGFFNTKKEIEYVKELKEEVDSDPIFNEKDKKILNPIHDNNLKKLNNKKLPFGVRTKNGIW
jgi:hypothetical protein